MTDIYLRPGKDPSFVLPPLSRRLEAGGRVQSQKKELRDWPEWCFLPLAGPTCHPPSSPGRHPRSLSQPGGDGGDAPACALISAVLTGTHSESARGMNLMPDP